MPESRGITQPIIGLPSAVTVRGACEGHSIGMTISPTTTIVSTKVPIELMSCAFSSGVRIYRQIALATGTLQLYAVMERYPTRQFKTQNARLPAGRSVCE
jgi:hypothetical protein